MQLLKKDTTPSQSLNKIMTKKAPFPVTTKKFQVLNPKNCKPVKPQSKRNIFLITLTLTLNLPPSQTIKK